MKTREEAVWDLLDWHRVVDSGLREAYYFPAMNAESADEPISLLEVSAGTFPSGRVDTFTFRGTEDIPYPLRIATITPEEMHEVQEGRIPLPPGWDLGSAVRLDLPAIPRRWRKSLPRRANHGTGQRGLLTKRLPAPAAKRPS